jgi:hypothetical protein
MNDQAEICCDDCAHMVRARLFSGFHELRCGHPSMRSRVTNQPITSCRWARLSEKACGPDARWFAETRPESHKE